jgi:peptide-methionine (R)-S-oxide reductase
MNDGSTTGKFAVDKSEDEWRRALTPEQFEVLRKHGTERAGTSSLNYEKRDGTYRCAGCDQVLFEARTKYESGSGWPSFWAPVEGAIETRVDRSLFMRRVEVHCSRCGGHLGHVFDDGPKPTGQRYCMNGLALQFDPKESSGS